MPLDIYRQAREGKPNPAYKPDYPATTDGDLIVGVVIMLALIALYTYGVVKVTLWWTQ